MFLLVQSKFEPRRACHYLDFYDRIQFRASQNVKPVACPRLATLIAIGLYRLTYIQEQLSMEQKYLIQQCSPEKSRTFHTPVLHLCCCV
jgi:hypothetical protein